MFKIVIMKAITPLESLDNLTQEAKELVIFDTHCHLSDESYSNEEVLQIVSNPFFKSGKNCALNVGCDLLSNKRLIEQSKNFPSNFYYAVGIHPNSNNDLKDENIKWLEWVVSKYKISAIGEIGLDYYRSMTKLEKQKVFLKKQILLAKKYNLPFLLHLRDKGDNNVFYDAISLVKEVGWCRGLVHCFSGNYEVAEEFVKLGFYISFSGTITFGKNSEISKVIKSVPLDRILVETDSPYLSPSPLRGRRNYPWNVSYNLKFISELLKIPLFEISSITFNNAFNFLNNKHA